jgi:hypothetical protein
MGIIEVGESPALLEIKVSCVRKGEEEQTYKRDEVVEEDQEVAVDGEIEDVAQVAVVGFLVELEGEDHDPSSDDESQHDASNEDQDILGDKRPGGMRGSKEGRLMAFTG